jgi:putative transposase
VIKTIKYRLYPTEKQKVLLNKHFDTCRFVYNLALQTNIMVYNSSKIHVGKFELMRQLTQLKAEQKWMFEVCAHTLANEISRLDMALSSFFKKRTGFPKYRKKSLSASLNNFHGEDIRIKDDRIYIPKFKTGIKYSNSKNLAGLNKGYTINRTSTNKYYITIVVECESVTPSPASVTKSDVLGVDLGLTHYAITSNGEKIENPKLLRKSLSKLKYLSKSLSRKEKSGKNRMKARFRLSLQHEKVANQRNDFTHKLSSKLVNDSQVLVFEDLNVSGMVKNRKLSLSISDASWGGFVAMCNYKTIHSGKLLIKIPRFEPSSKRCSDCNELNTLLKLSDREWSCESCGSIHDRDINAAINIKNYVVNNYCGGMHREKPVELSAIVEAMKQESKSKLQSIRA